MSHFEQSYCKLHAKIEYIVKNNKKAFESSKTKVRDKK